MANSASISALQKKLWRKELYKDVMDENYFAQSGLMGEGENNIIQVLNDLKKESGDTITIPLTAKLSGKGVAGDAELEGNVSNDKKEDVNRAIKNSNKKPSSASLGGSGKSNFKSEDTLTPEDVVNFSTTKWMGLSKKTRDRLLQESS